MPKTGSRVTPAPAAGTRERRISVLVADDHPGMLAHVAGLLDPEFTVAALVPDAESLLAGWWRARPDVIVLDMSLPRCSGLEAARRLRAADCPAPIVFLSVERDPEIVRAAWAAGARGYVAKQDVDRELMPAIHAVCAGRRFASTAIQQ